MTITPEIWKALANAIASMEECPPWLKEQVVLGWEAISKLPAVDATGDGEHGLPTVEMEAVTPEYLDFLREQVQLNPRGPEWLALIKRRLAALEPFADKQLIVATFYSKPHTAIFRIHPDTGDLVHVEMY